MEVARRPGGKWNQPRAGRLPAIDSIEFRPACGGDGPESWPAKKNVKISENPFAIFPNAGKMRALIVCVAERVR
jgi:hypothetical protein